MIVAVTGIRDLHPQSQPDVVRVISELVHTADVMRFGGARGVDTVALDAAGRADSDCRLVVLVPGRLRQQPNAAQFAIKQYAHRVVELKLILCRDAYLQRNDQLLEGADLLAAFPDQSHIGGTGYTIGQARRLGLRVLETIVRKQ